jgi:KipI family sensor histidine kinase inhibitor
MVALTEPDSRSHVATALSRALPHCDVRSGMAAVLVVAPEPDRGLLGVVDEAVAGLGASSQPPTSRATIDIPVTYRGEDLTTVADLLDCDVDAVVAAHREQSWSVAMMGFAAGFGYLVPLGRPLLPWSAVERLDRARLRVPAGSVALAAGMSAVYPEQMPGGWRLIGVTSARLFDATDDADPSLLHPGDVVRFVEAASRP